MFGGRPQRGFLMRLLRDVRGNTLVIMTAALIPLAGLVGGGIDMSRMYILKTRLQHACDAGTLAGRKSMGGGTWSYNDYYPRREAEKFFDANFQNGLFSSTSLSRVFTETGGKVTGAVSATIPMTLMRIFGKTTETLAVTCDAEMRLPNTDVMFVLDTTGSMGAAQPGDSVSKMTALKTAVKCFYEIVARLDTNAVCATGAPSGGTSPQIQVRFGFVPYSMNVRVGHLLPTEWFVNTAVYPTRQPIWGDPTWRETSTQQQGSETISRTGVPQNQCTDASAEANGYNSQTGYTSTSSTTRWYDKTTTRVTNWDAANNGTCTGQRTRVRHYETLTPGALTGWRYGNLPVDVGQLKNGTAWRASMTLPVEDGGGNRTIPWDGCIEERKTGWFTNFEPLPAGAIDLDIDRVPDNDDSRWRPALPHLTYARGAMWWEAQDTSRYIRDEVRTDANTNYSYYPSYVCPREARLLQQWPDAGAFDNYVDSLNPNGNTYHDIGLLWGARLASPTGLFASQNAHTATGGDIERHLIFMTDGDACSQTTDYSAYGFNWFMRRTTNPDVEPTGGCVTNNATLVEQVNKRTEGLCTAIKNKNITLWVVAFGDLHPESVTRLTKCASSGRYFTATNSAQLQQTFRSIADQISQLRLTQ